MTVYGFVSWMAASVSMAVWTIWAFLPDKTLEEVCGLSYYPQKWWALAIPTWLIFSAFTAAFLYHASFWYVAPPLNARILLVDSATLNQKIETQDFEIKSARDIPLETVNRLMFGASY